MGPTEKYFETRQPWLKIVLEATKNAKSNYAHNVRSAQALGALLALELD